MVRLLHPDSQREMTAQKTEWWHQAQAAYEARDAEQLEVILTLCEISENGTIEHTSASLLQRITAQLKSSLREIKRQTTQRRREPAWNFSNRTDLALMTDQVRRDLMDELLAIRRRWMDTREIIAKWKAAAAKLKSPRRRKAQSQNPEFLFDRGSENPLQTVFDLKPVAPGIVRHSIRAGLRGSDTVGSGLGRMDTGKIAANADAPPGGF